MATTTRKSYTSRMTNTYKLRRSSHRSSEWLDTFTRTMGCRGMNIQDVDYMIQNYLTNDMLLIEAKCYGAVPDEAQRWALLRLDRIMRAGCQQTRPPWKYHGIWLLQLGGTSPHDGDDRRLVLNGVEVTETELKQHLTTFDNPAGEWGIEKWETLR